MSKLGYRQFLLNTVANLQIEVTMGNMTEGAARRIGTYFLADLLEHGMEVQTAVELLEELIDPGAWTIDMFRENEVYVQCGEHGILDTDRGSWSVWVRCDLPKDHDPKVDHRDSSNSLEWPVSLEQARQEKFHA